MEQKFSREAVVENGRSPNGGGSSQQSDLAASDSNEQEEAESTTQPQIVREDPEKYVDEDGKKDGESEKKGGRRKINIEFIENKSRRHVTFSKRKAGLIKKAYELSTLTGTQVLLLVASETGNVYTFATPKLQPLITKPEGKTLIQACLNPPEVSELPSQQQSGSSMLPQRMPSQEPHVFAEKKAPSPYQAKDTIQNMWAPLQDRLIKDSGKVVSTASSLSEMGSYGAYGQSAPNASSLASPAYSQYNYAASMGFGMNSVPRYNQYPSPSGAYSQFGSQAQPSHSQSQQYSAPSSYLYPSSVTSSSQAPYPPNSSLDNSSKDPTIG